MNQGRVFTTQTIVLRESLNNLLDISGLNKKIRTAKTILIKPNLVDALPPPVTTPVDIIAALIDYLHEHCQATIIIGEGTASASHDTFYIFNKLGYTEMAGKKNVKLVDLNQEKSVLLQQKKCKRWPEMHLPEIVFNSFLLSVPVLKAHTLADITLTLKNMMGLPPPTHYQQGNGWKKSKFHYAIGPAIADLNRYRCPDFTLLDGREAMVESHLWGRTLSPAPNMLIASSDPVAIDAYGAGILGINWRDIDHIRGLHGELGQAEPLQVVVVI